MIVYHFPAVGAGKALPPPGALKKELIQARRRESELNSRVAALEAQLKQATAAQASATEQLQDLLDDTSAKLEVLPPALTSRLSNVHLRLSAQCVWDVPV